MPEEFQKHTVNLRPGDYAYLQQVFGPSGVPAAVMIRKIIAKHVDYLRSKEDPITLTLEIREPKDE
jgi:hypothetical protein